VSLAVSSQDRHRRIISVSSISTIRASPRPWWCIGKLHTVTLRLLQGRVVSVWPRHHELSSWFSELDLADGVGECRVLLARTSSCGLAVLAVLGLLEGDLFPIGITVNVDVGDAHCDGCWWVNVCVFCLLVG
jgi:hypothetical protein